MNAGPARPRLALEKFLEMKIQRNEMEMAKMRPHNVFITQLVGTF